MSEISEQSARRLLDAVDAYDARNEFYDDIFNETGERLRDQGFATKQDVASVSFWKAINLSTRWVNEFLATDPRVVEDASRRAFQDGIGDRERLISLQVLPGFRSWGGRTGGAIPSTLLCCWDPVNYAVTDIRAREGLDSFGLQAKDLVEYWHQVRVLRDAARGLRSSVTARDIDKALFEIAGSKKRL